MSRALACALTGVPLLVGAAALADHSPLPSPSALAISHAPTTPFALVGTHPDASRQPTAAGKELRTLFPWQGRLYAGYGDYGANTGPIGITPFDPATGQFDRAWLSDTEAIYNYRAIRGRLYAPSTDPRKDADYAVGEPWADLRSVNSTHSYDMVSLDGTDLWLVGSQGTNATAWRSLDDGATWTGALAQGPVHGLDGDFARFYFAGVLDGRLYVQGADYSGGPHPRSKAFDGTAWADGPDLLAGMGMGWRPEPFVGELVYRSAERGGRLLRFDGAQMRHAVGLMALDVHVAGTELYALAQRAAEGGAVGWQPPQVMRTTDLQAWEALGAELPAGARSLARLDDRLYVGTAESQLFRMELEADAAWAPVALTWNAPPSARIVRPPDGARFEAPAAIHVVADVRDPDGTPVIARFWNGSTKLGEAADAPHAIVWPDVPPGTWRIGLRAVDAAGAYADDHVTITVVTGTNRAPQIVSAEAQPNPSRPGEPVAFAVQAVDAHGDPLGAWWDLGDGASATGMAVDHAYAGPGAYTAEVLVTDGRGGLARAVVRVAVRALGGLYLPWGGRQ